MKYPRYPKYKDSGVEWLGEVPEGWGVQKFRHAFKESPEKIIDPDSVVGPMLSVSGYRGIEIKDYDDENRRRLDDELVGYRIVRLGQLVVNTMWLNHAGLGVSEYEGHVSPAYKSYWINALLHKRFAHHMMRSSIFVQGYTMFLMGIRPNSLQMSRDDLMAFLLLVPPYAEQAAIAAFLDRETAKIDALIAEQEKLITLLQEKRQAVISHAVTKGLNPDAPMRDSGVEWLGEVPEGWEISRLKFVANIQTGIAKGKEYKNIQTTSVSYLRVANVQNGFLALEDLAEIELPFEDIERYRLRVGDVLMNEGGDFDKLGRGAIWNGEVSVCIHQNHVFSVRPYAISSDWLNMLTSSRYAQCYFISRSKQSTNLASISSSNLMELPVILPSEEEQNGILHFIDVETAKIDALIAESQKAVDLLKERRAALISAAVTGKIDVRDFA